MIYLVDYMFEILMYAEDTTLISILENVCHMKNAKYIADKIKMFTMQSSNLYTKVYVII